MSITDHPITQRRILEKLNPKQHRCENLKIGILETGFPSGDYIFSDAIIWWSL